MLLIKGAMPSQSIYGAILYRPSSRKETIFTKDMLRDMQAEYKDTVEENEIRIFTNYIMECILECANMGKSQMSLPVLKKGALIAHMSNGLLDKYEPGPIPQVYMTQILQNLKIKFPDTEILINETAMLFDWS
jgi:hypothetical protein